MVGFISTSYVSKNNNEFNKVGHACNGERVCMNKRIRVGPILYA